MNLALGIQFHWGKAVTEVHSGYICLEGQKIQADRFSFAADLILKLYIRKYFPRFAMTRCKLQMMRMKEEGSPRIGSCHLRRFVN
ncbi:MAG: hypothetical protein WDM78_05040 [Puia sp.]